MIAHVIWRAGAALALAGVLAAPHAVYAADGQSAAPAARLTGLPGGPLLIPQPQQDLNGVWWTSSYTPRIAPAEGGAIPFTPAGRQAYD